ncbi:MAG: 23S rRNA (guanosine(2251)-2'-O)-methyltransferase RlmB [Gammaproteobacteria bacterium]|nr:23S rRNA (guanosine(2251)-2'-O)-methyltransferase RlmB [Gammaproteobacteria bacterium]MBU2677289.1 23S rRNA (guanosine(2251)-2'-O)-methyltransferase RlmB [Gammaproteobacteria bacterium]NNC58147.1 23S rRNA (guanosine(2251)-2'-O)-methyltransferase RlmB [Woeseiaceae bacterium]NNL51020.1 23S rRNA (guanosine(2251)-2'-O)-methyltransferase RlmB [Woeseiaceae bacterium]
MSKSQYITGLRAVEQLLNSESADIRQVYAEYQTANPRVQAVIAEARKAGIEIQAANRARLTQISGESRHQGIVAEVRRSSVMDEGGLRTLVEERLQDPDGRPLLLLVLDGVQDPHNLGACMRTADAAGVDALVVPRRGAAGLGPTVSKVAAGAAEQLSFVPVANLGRVLAWLSDYGVRCVGTSDKADESLFDADLTGSVALVMGREHTGLSKGITSRCDTLIKLPMEGVVSSLNVSVATGICLYEIVRQRHLRMP